MKLEVNTRGEQARRFPLGAAVTAEALAEDPYPTYARLRQHEPVSWVGALGMYLVVSHAQFLLLIGKHVERYRVVPDKRVRLSVLANAPGDVRLSYEAIARNLLVVLFGGISTIEALVLNALHALSLQPETFERVRADPPPGFRGCRRDHPLGRPGAVGDPACRR